MDASARTTAPTRRLPRPADLGDEVLVVGLAAFAVYHFTLAVWMAVAPHSFYTAIGPFGPYNSHYIRDTATFNAALGAGFLVAVFRPSWRLPVLAITTLQFALHTVNHLVDIDKADPAGIGYFDFFSLLISTCLLGLLLARSRRRPPDSKEARR
jgi:hypothetical protein